MRWIAALILSWMWARESAGQCRVLDTYDNPAAWTRVHTGIAIANGAVQVTNTNGGNTPAELRGIYRNIGTTYTSDSAFRMDIDLNYGDCGDAGSNLEIAVLTAGTKNPVNDVDGFGNIIQSNQDALGLHFHSFSTTDVYFAVFVRDGDVDAPVALNGAIPLPSFNTSYYMRLERLAPTVGRLSIFSDTGRTQHIPQSPFCFAIPAGITGLNTIWHSSSSQGAPERDDLASIDNLCISSLPHYQQTPVTVSASQTLVCERTPITLTSNATVPVRWTEAQAGFADSVSPIIFTPPRPGTYNIIASWDTLGSDCTPGLYKTILQVTSLGRPAIQLGPDRFLCRDTAITLTAITPSNQLRWSTGDTAHTLRVGIPGYYFVTAGPGFCSRTDTIRVTNINPTLTLGPDVYMCRDTAITLSAITNDRFIAWGAGDTSVTLRVTQPGRYTAVAGRETCLALDTISVRNIAPTLSLGVDRFRCRDSAITLRAATNTPLRWSTGDTTHAIVATHAGAFTARAGIGRCLALDTIVVTDFTPSLALGPDRYLCRDTGIAITATSNAALTWNTGDTTHILRIIRPGIYTAISGRGGCLAFDTLAITNLAPTLSLGPDTFLCRSAAITLTAQTNTPIVWNTGERDTSILARRAGVYAAFAGIGRCLALDTILVRDFTPTLSLGPDRYLCRDTAIVIAATTNAPVLRWSTGDTARQIIISMAGTFRATAGRAECQAFDTVSVSDYAPTLSLGPDAYLCRDSAITVTALTAGRIRWSTGDTTLSIIIRMPGTYTAFAGKDHCLALDTLTVSDFTPTASFGPDVFMCRDTAIYLRVRTDAPGIHWSTGDTMHSILATQAGLYTVRVGKGRCLAFDTIKVINVAPMLDVGPDMLLCPDSSLTLTAMTAYPLLWSTGDTTRSLLIARPELYTAQTGIGRCLAFDSVIVSARNPYICRDEIDLPNIVTPNGDYINEIFEPMHQVPWPAAAQVRIYSRYGTLVYDDKPGQTSWPSSDTVGGTYYFLASLPGGRQIKGWVEVVR